MSLAQAKDCNLLLKIWQGAASTDNNIPQVWNLREVYERISMRNPRLHPYGELPERGANAMIPIFHSI